MKEIEPFIFRHGRDSEYKTITIVRRILLDDDKIVCEKYDEELCMKNCKGMIGYGCKKLPPDFYKGVSGYSAK